MNEQLDIEQLLPKPMFCGGGGGGLNGKSFMCELPPNPFKFG